MVGSQHACKRCFAAVEASPHRELFYPFPAAPTLVPAPEADEVHEAKAPQLDDVKDFLAGKGMEYSSEITAKLLQAGMDINIVAKCVEDYQLKFLHIYKQSPQMAEAFTPEVWTALQPWNQTEGVADNKAPAPAQPEAEEVHEVKVPPASASARGRSC